MSEILLSVVVSSYNQETYIAECLQSIIDQVTDFKFEIVVADDYSTDSTGLIIAEFLEKYPSLIRVLENTSNLGAAKNYYRVHQAAIGKYVAHIDGDDVMLSNKLQKQVEVLERNPDCNFVIHAANYFNDDRSYIASTGFLGDKDVTFFSIKQQARWPTLSVHSSYMYRNSARKTRIYTREIMEWFYAMEYLLDSENATAAFINEVLVMYRCNENGLAYTRSASGRSKANKILIDNIVFYFNFRPDLNAHLFSNLIVSAAANFFSSKKIDLKLLSFIFKNLTHLNFKYLIESIKIKSNIRPKGKFQ